MQGQKSAIGSLPDTVNFEYGSPSSNIAIDEQICWNNLQNHADYRVPSSNADTFMGTVSQEGQPLSRWNIGEPSSSSSQNPVNHDELTLQSGHSSLLPIAASTGPGLEEQWRGPTNAISQANINLNLSSHQIVDGSSFSRGSRSNSIPHNYDINERPNLHNSSKSSVYKDKFISSASSSSDPFASSSGSGGFLVEEDDGRPGCSLDGRRLSCKRKALEGNAGQSSSSTSGSLRAESSIWNPVTPQYDTGSSSNVSTPEPVNPRLGLGSDRPVSSDNLHPLHVTVGAESSRRSYHMRANPSIREDSLSNNSFLLGSTVGFPDVPLVHHSSRFVPVNPPSNLMSPDNARRNMQALRYGGLSSIPGNPSGSGSVPFGERDGLLHEELNPRTMSRNISDHPIFVPAIARRNSAQNLTSLTPSSSNIGVSRNVSSSARTGSSLGSHSSPGPSWASHRHPSSRRVSEYVRRSLLLSSAGADIRSQNGNNLTSSGSGNAGHNQSYPRSGLGMDRQSHGVTGIPNSFRAWAAGEGRGRLVTEIRNVLDIMHRAEGLRFEDVAFFDQALLFGMADIHDQHRDMRLDVDNMSYEELLALEECIGDVCTGLSEETILVRMKQCKYLPPMNEDQTEAEPCCICQEEYKEGEDMGALDCGHEFHRECIKKWLENKNLCPICKTTALST